MASPQCPGLPDKPIRFFKIVLSDIGSHTKLMIPKNIVRILGKNLSDSIMLNAPSGSVWSIDIERCKGKVWLQNGWPEFAEFYLICVGYLLVFEYKGDSSFRVLIFDSSSSEIDYPLGSCSEKFNFVGSNPVKKRVIDIDDSPLTSSDDVVRPCKKTKGSSSCVGEKSQQEGEENKKSRGVNTKAEKSRMLESITVKSCKKTSASSFCIESCCKGPKLQHENENGNGESAGNVNRDRALASAKAFKSKNPFSITVLQPYHVNGRGTGMYITKIFKQAYKKWKNNDEVILQVAGRTWKVYCNLNLDLNQCRIRRGWSMFARENAMNVGDVCVFELINPSRKLFKVFIFRAANETNFNAFKYKNPFFRVKVCASYLYGGSMSLPK